MQEANAHLQIQLKQAQERGEAARQQAEAAAGGTRQEAAKRKRTEEEVQVGVASVRACVCLLGGGCWDCRVA